MSFSAMFVPQSGGLLAPTASMIAALVAAGMALLALRVNAAVNLRNKRIDVMVSCNQRYDVLSQEKSRIFISMSKMENTEDSKDDKIKSFYSIKHEIELYYRRYWGLKSDQVDYWLAGYIDPETMISWFMSTADSLHDEDELFRNYSSDLGWSSVRNFHKTTNERFYQIVSSLRHPKVKSMNSMKKYAYIFQTLRMIEIEEKSLISLFQKNGFERLWMDRFRSSLPKKVSTEVIPHELRKLFKQSMDLAKIEENSNN